MGFRGRKGSEKGFQKGLSRRHLEGGNMPCQDYDPVGVRPKLLGNARNTALRALFRKRELTKFCAKVLRTPRPLTALKDAPNPKFVPAIVFEGSLRIF